RPEHGAKPGNPEHEQVEGPGEHHRYHQTQPADCPDPCMVHRLVIYQRLQSAAMLADELIELHARPREVPPFTFRDPGLSADQGYAAALTLHRHRLGEGWKPLGRKIGFTNRTIWPRYGVYEPIWGTVYDHTVVASDGKRARIPLRGLVQPR